MRARDPDTGQKAGPAEDARRAAESRASQVRRVLYIVLGLNLAVACVKAAYGLLSGSLAIASDAIHSTVDASSNVLGLLVMRYAMAPPDRGHPYGHRKLEIVAATGIGLAIGYAAVRFTWSAVAALVRGATPPSTSLAGFAIVAGTLVVNVFVASYERRRARALGSAYLAADAAHTASDVLVTSAVLISFAASHFGVAWADPLGALAVIAVIAWVAWTILAENIGILVDRAVVDPHAVEVIALSIPCVRGCHRVRSRGTSDAVHLDLHVLVDGDLSLRRSHAITHEVERALRERLPSVVDVTIHVEPEDDPEEGL